MSAAVQILEETGSALRVALASQNWEAIGELDQRCRQAVDEAMLDVQDEATLRARMEELLALYRERRDTASAATRAAVLQCWMDAQAYCYSAYITASKLMSGGSVGSEALREPDGARFTLRLPLRER